MDSVPVRKRMVSVKEQFIAALGEQIRTGHEPSSITVESCDSPTAARLAGVGDDAISAATAKTLGLPFADSLTGHSVSHEFLEIVPIAYARLHGMIGLTGEGESMSRVARTILEDARRREEGKDDISAGNG